MDFTGLPGFAGLTEAEQMRCAELLHAVLRRSRPEREIVRDLLAFVEEVARARGVDAGEATSRLVPWLEHVAKLVREETGASARMRKAKERLRGRA